MLKKLPTALTKEIHWQGDVVATVRAVTPADLAAILVEVGEDIGALFDLNDDVKRIDITTKDKAALADQILSKWPSLLNAVSIHFPNLIAKIIARAADEPDAWEMVNADYSVVLQMDILAEIARLTFNDPEGFRRFVGNVLALVDLTGTLTGAGKKRPSISGPQQSSAAG